MAKKKQQQSVDVQYRFRGGARIPRGLEAQVVGESLEDIRHTHGFIEPRIVVDTARPDTHSLHPAFTWDDAIAAERHREWEARELIRAVRIVRPDADGNGDEPAYINVKKTVAVAGDDAPTGSYYQSARVVVGNIDEFERAMELAIARVTAAKRAVEELEQLASGMKNADTLAKLAVALKALETAGDAVRSTKH